MSIHANPYGFLMMYALEGLLGDMQYIALGMVLEALNRLWAKSFKRSELKSLQELVHGAVLHTSVAFPVYQHDMIVHLLHHVVDGITENGPPWALAMWAFERLWGILIDQNKSTPHPATSMMLNVRAAKLASSIISKQTLVFDVEDKPEGEVRMSLLLDEHATSTLAKQHCAHPCSSRLH